MRTNAEVNDGLYDVPLVNRIASTFADATVAFLLVLLALTIAAPGARGQSATANAIDTTAPVVAVDKSGLATPHNQTTLSEVDRLTVESTYKDAMLASAEVQRIQAAILAASPDYQKALVAFNDSATKYNELVAKLQGTLPKGSTIAVDPITRVASVKPPPTPAPAAKSDAPTPKK